MLHYALATALLEQLSKLIYGILNYQQIILNIL